MPEEEKTIPNNETTISRVGNTTAAFFTNRKVKYLGAREAEMNYIVGVGVFLYGNYCYVPTWLSLTVIIAWNMLDASVAAAAAATIKVESKQNYRYQTHEKRKAIFWVISAAGLVAFTCSASSIQGTVADHLAVTAGLVAYAGIVFALAMMWDFFNAIPDRWLAAKKAEFIGWLEEADKEIRFLIENIDQEGNKNKLIEMLNTLYARCSIRYYAGDPLNVNAKIKAILESLSTVQVEGRNLSDLTSFNLLFNPCVAIDRNNPLPAPQNYMNVINEEQIQADLLKNKRYEDINLVLKCLSFIGMSLIATQQIEQLKLTIPGSEVVSGYFVGALLVGIVALFYTVRFMRDLYDNYHAEDHSALGYAPVES